MGSQNISDLIDSLTPQEQDAVREFIKFLKAREDAPQSSFLEAADEFIHLHPELLRRLAQ